MSTVDLSIVIPCYNEIETIEKLKRELLPVVRQLVSQRADSAWDESREENSRLIEVIFVDDGSTDGTFFALLDAFGDDESENGSINLRFAQHRTNQGLGAALRTGFDMARGAVIVTTDCDGTYHFDEIPKLLSRLTPSVDLVTASPYHPDGAVDGVSPYRLLLSRGSSAIYRMLADRRIYTYTALFRAYRREVIQNVPFHSTGFLAGTELLVNAIRMGYRVSEYPTVLHSRVHGISKAKVARTVQAHIGFQINSLLPWHPYGFVICGEKPTIYLWENGQKYAFPSAEVFLSYGYHWQQIVQISEEELADLPEGLPLTFRDGTLIRGGDETVYVVESGYRRPFATAKAFEAMGYRWSNVMQVPGTQLEQLPVGESIALEEYPNGTLLQATDETVYQLIDGKRCVIPTVQIFQSWGFQWHQIVPVADETLVRYPLGEPVSAQKSRFHHWRALQSNGFCFDKELPLSHIAA